MKPKPAFLGSQYGRQFEDASIAAVYRKRPPYPAETFRLLGELMPPTNRRLLDLGSGTGEIAIPMAGAGLSVTAVEPSAAMLDIARAKAGAAEVEWHNLSAESFDYPARYGLITCAQSLGWMDWEVVFPKMAAALDNSGSLAIIQQSEPFADAPWQSELRQLISRYSTNQDFIPFDLIDGLVDRKLFNQQGITHTESVPFDQTIGDFINSIHARNGFSRQRMAPGKAEEFDELVETLLVSYQEERILTGSLMVTIVWGKPVD